MGTLKYLLDSTVLIDAINKVPAAEKFLLENQAACGIGPITRAEVLAGVADADSRAIGALLSAFSYLELDIESVDLAAAVRRERRWKQPDAFQAAMARRHGLKLVTRNTKDFPPSRYPFVLVPYQIP